MSTSRCPVLVGRRPELGELRSALAAARLGRGTAVALTGPAGIGKSRLVRELLVTEPGRDLRHAVGRAVPGGGPFRPLTQALLAGLRLDPELATATGRGAGPLAELRPLLGRVLPQWRTADVVAENPLVVAEAVLQTLVVLAGGQGLMVVLEDLHWTDPETLDVLDHLADNVADRRVALVLTAREEPGAVLRSLRALADRDVCRRYRLAPLARSDITEVVEACRGGPVPVDVRDVVARRSGGVPFLVEELIAGPDPAADVPASFAESVSDRLASLPPAAARLVGVAAVVGETVDLWLIGAVLGADEVEVLDAVRDVVRTGLLDTVHDEPGVVRFQHALSRDAVLTALLPADRVRYARRALDEVRRARPDLDDGWRETAGRLAVLSGDDGAAGLLHEAGRRYLAQGALASAETALRQARAYAGAFDRTIEADLAETLLCSGRLEEAAATTASLLTTPDDGSGVPGDAHIQMARIRAATGDRIAAADELDQARRRGADPVRTAAVGAQIAIADGRLDDAHALAVEAKYGAMRAGRPDVVVDSLLVLGRLARRADLAEASRLFGRALAEAEASGAAVGAARAEYELAITDVQHGARLDRLAAARSRLRTVGDLAAVAVLDLQEAATRVVRWEPEEALAAAERCVLDSRRLRLPTLPKALLLTAAALTHLDRHEPARAAVREALALAPDDTHIDGEAEHVYAVRALARADDVGARRRLDRAVAAFRRRPGEVTASPAVGLWVVVSTVADPAVIRIPGPPAPVADRCNRGMIRFAEAVAAARAGRVGDAVTAFDDADRMLREPVDLGWYRCQARRLVTAAALADGWGEPRRWVAEDLPVVEERGSRAWAGALRGQLRRAGAVVPRRSRGTTTVPARLRALGVTSREVDVLVLVAEGCANREVADRLVLSPRTVEKHVEHLLAKTGHRRRTELVAAAAVLLAPDPAPAV